MLAMITAQPSMDMFSHPVGSVTPLDYNTLEFESIYDIDSSKEGVMMGSIKFKVKLTGSKNLVSSFLSFSELQPTVR